MRNSYPEHDPRLLITPEKVRSLDADDLLRSYSAPLPPDVPLRTMSIEGLLSFGDRVDFEFGRLNLLVGPNGSGKSNLISCIRLLALAPLDIQIDFKRNGFEEWMYQGISEERPSSSIEVRVKPPGTSELLHRITLRPAPHSRATLEERIGDAEDYKGIATPYFAGSAESDAVVLGGGSGRLRRPRKLTTSEYSASRSILQRAWDAGNYPELKGLADLYLDFSFYTEWTFGRQSILRGSIGSAEDGRRMAESLVNLPLVLRDLRDAEAIQKIRDLLEELKETYRGYEAIDEGPQVRTFIHEVPFDLPIPSSRLSDGTLRFLALAAILLHPDTPALICIEEPELGMHPDMIRLVGSMIVDASKRTQVIISTHSEHLLTALEEDFDRLLAFDASPTGTLVRALTRDDYMEWRADHELGLLWSSGELGGVRY